MIGIEQKDVINVTFYVPLGPNKLVGLETFY